MARLGGIARAKSMTAEERRKSAMKAAKAAALVHKKRAKAKKAAQEEILESMNIDQRLRVQSAPRSMAKTQKERTG